MKETKDQLHKGSMGTASLVCGICGLVFFPFVLSTLAIIFGAIGISRQEKYAKAGLILGIVGWVMMIVLFIVLFSFFMAILGAL